MRELVCQKRALKNIIWDIYGHNYGGVKKLGLANSTNIDDFQIKLESLKSVWDNLCPGFQGVYYNNSIETQRFREKMEQSFKKKIVGDVISTLKKLVDRQEDDKVRTIYGSGPYHLSTQYKKFQQWNKSLESLRNTGKKPTKSKEK